MDEAQLKEFKDFLENIKGISSKHTLYRYCKALEKLDIEKLSQDYINQYIQNKRNDSVIRGAMLNFLEWTGLKKEIDMPPRATGRKPKRVVREIGIDEIRLIREYLYSQSFKKGLVFDLIYQGALRAGELTSIRLNSFKWLKWLDDTSKPCHLIIKGKGDKERIVLINPETTEFLFKHYMEKYGFNDEEQIRAFVNSSLILLTGEKNKVEFPYKTLWKIIDVGSRQALGRHIRPHELRHARATELERMGVPVQDIKTYLGHAFLSTTEIYLHKSEKESIDNIQNKIY